MRTFFTRLTQQVVAKTRNFSTKKVVNRENVAYLGAFIGFSALSFQVAVLHPYHTELSDQFAGIQKTVAELELLNKEIGNKIGQIYVIQEEVKIKELRILDREDEILAKDKEVLKLVKKISKAYEMEDQRRAQKASH